MTGKGAKWQVWGLGRHFPPQHSALLSTQTRDSPWSPPRHSCPPSFIHPVPVTQLRSACSIRSSCQHPIGHTQVLAWPSEFLLPSLLFFFFVIVWTFTFLLIKHSTFHCFYYIVFLQLMITHIHKDCYWKTSFNETFYTCHFKPVNAEGRTSILVASRNASLHFQKKWIL